MKIAIDAHMVGERETGNESYTVNLLRGLAATDSGDIIQVLTPHPGRLRAIIDLPARFEIIPVTPAQPWLRIPFAMPSAVRRHGSELLHVSYIAPPLVRCPTVVTVHDLSFLIYPKSVTLRTRLILGSLVPLSIRRAARVIAVSEHTKRDLIERYGIPAEKITVVYEAAGPAFHETSATSLPPGVTEPFVLAVGNVEPRKNLERLVDAFAALASGGTFSGQLVIAGKQTGRAESVGRAVRNHGLERRIVFTGYLTEAELNGLYNRAALFVYPSLYEGFGLPPLEAMRCGCPVVASNASAMPEVLGDAALLVDPRSSPAIAQAMEAVLTRTELRQALREKGRRRAERFSWEKAALETRAVYAAACAAASAAGAA